MLRLSALAVMALAIAQAVRLRELAGTGLLLEGSERAGLVALLLLVAAWGLVLVLSFRDDARRLRAGTLAQGLAGGALALGVVTVALPLIGGGRAGGPILGTLPFMLVSLVPQALALMAAARERRLRQAASGGGGGAWRRVASVAAAGASFVLSTIAVRASSVCYFTEARAIGELRTFLSAQLAYASVGGGFGSPECLVRPASCGAFHPEDGSSFLDPSFLRPVRCGYRFTFHPGPSRAPAPGGGPPGASPGLESYTIIAVPTKAGVSGVRAFCADASGAIWASGDGRLPPWTSVGCPEGLLPLR